MDEGYNSVFSSLRNYMSEDNDLAAAMIAAHTKESQLEAPAAPEAIIETGVVNWDRLNDAGAEDAGLSPFEWLEEEDELKTAISAARRKIIMPDMEDLLHCVKVREVGQEDGGGKVWGAYFPHTVITDILNKAFGMRVRLVEDGRKIEKHPIGSVHPRTKEVTYRYEAWLWGRLEVWDNNDRVLISIPCDGSMAFRGRAQSIGQCFEGARSNMIRKAATRINPHLGLADPKFHEKALWYHGKQSKPDRDTWMKLYTALGVDGKDAAWPKLLELGIGIDDWEKECKNRLMTITLEARRRVNS